MKNRIGLTVMLAVLVNASFMLAGALAVDITMHEISVKIAPDDHYLEAEDRLTLMADTPGMYTFLLNENLAIHKLVLDGVRLQVKELSGRALNEQFPRLDDKAVLENAKGIAITIRSPGKHYLEISYKGIVYDTLQVPDHSRGAIPEETSGIISGEGVYLSGSTHWYPAIPGDMSFFVITVTTPPQFESVTEGKRVRHAAGKKSLTTEWELFYPTRGVTLVAGRYIVQEEQMDGITLMAYFFPSEKELIAPYLDATKRFIDMYNRLIGPYPFSKFAIVENFFPTGYGMPSYTLLGRRVIRLPWIVDTSLGHEVAHNWWGNSVYPDYSTGNWCEGLTVYYADHRYKLTISDSAAVDYRRVLNTDYTSYVNSENDFPLTEFKERTTPGSKAIGYGKCAFVFHMLKDIVGEETFYRTLRTFYEQHQFKESSWNDIQALFEKLSGRDLQFYFDQWVRKTGAPMIEFKDARVDSVKGTYEIHVRIGQHPAYRLLLPVTVTGADTASTHRVWISCPETTVTIKTPFRPISVGVDPQHDLFRRLSPFEIPPTISAVMGDPDLAIVLPTRADSSKRAVFENLAAQLSRTGEGIVMEDSAVTVADLEKRSLLILGDRDENALLAIIEAPPDIGLAGASISLAGKEYAEPGHGAFLTFRSPFNAAKSISVITGRSTAAVEKAGYKIIHYGKYSFVVFLDGQRIEAGIVPAANNPMIRTLERGQVLGSESPF
jgi:aminopeptidase N